MYGKENILHTTYYILHNHVVFGLPYQSNVVDM
jgi:hypothetical protein